MYCLKCGTENLGDAQVCQGCGGVFVHSASARTSGMAVTSMILGISGFSVFGASLIAWIMGLVMRTIILITIGLSMSGVSGITWVIGLIFGIKALNKIVKNSGKIKGKGWAVTGIVTSSVGLALVLTIFGICIMFTAVHTTSLKKQIVDLKDKIVIKVVEGSPSIDGVVRVVDFRADGSDVNYPILGQAYGVSSDPMVSCIGCGPGDDEQTKVEWVFIGVKDGSDAYNFKITPGGSATVIQKTVVYDGKEQIVYEDKTVKVVIEGKKALPQE